MYVPGKLVNTDSVIIDIGTSYYVEKVFFFTDIFALLVNNFFDPFRTYQQEKTTFKEKLNL